MSQEATWLLCLLLVAHFAGDFTPLATRKMQEAKVGLRHPGLIAAHAGVHTVLVFAVVEIVVRSWSLALVAAAIQFPAHLAIDFVKMKIGRGFDALSDPDRSLFWTFLGFDQLLHGLVLVAIAGSAL